MEKKTDPRSGRLNLYSDAGYTAGTAPTAQLDVVDLSVRIMQLELPMAVPVTDALGGGRAVPPEQQATVDCLELTVRPDPASGSAVQRFVLQVPASAGDATAVHAWAADLEAVCTARKNWGLVQGALHAPLGWAGKAFGGAFGGAAGLEIGRDAGRKISGALGLRR